MRKKNNLKLIGIILLSLVDDIIILAIVIIILLQFGITLPWWALAIIILVLSAVTYLIFRILRKNPQLGFDNMVGLTGVAVGPVGRKGTVRIKGELWSAASRGEEIEDGTEILVVEQIGLKLTVIPLRQAREQV